MKTYREAETFTTIIVRGSEVVARATFDAVNDKPVVDLARDGIVRAATVSLYRPEPMDVWTVVRTSNDSALSGKVSELCR